MAPRRGRRVDGTVYVLPLWRVDLIAPQYPEGLGMLIRVNGVDGIKENDLNSINGPQPLHRDEADRARVDP
jgi:hypothetical protein